MSMLSVIFRKNKVKLKQYAIATLDKNRETIVKTIESRILKTVVVANPTVAAKLAVEIFIEIRDYIINKL